MPPNIGSMIPKTEMPKAAQARPRLESVSFLFSIGVVAAISVGAAYGILIFYGRLSDSSLQNAKVTLQDSQKQFEPKVISDITTLDRQLKISKQLLNTHVQLSPVMKMLGELTSAGIQYDKFTYVASGNEIATIKIEGLARSYLAIAQQSTIFNNDPRVAEPYFSDFSQTESGRIRFNLRLVPNPNILKYVLWNKMQTDEASLFPVQSIPQQTSPSDSPLLPEPVAPVQSPSGSVIPSASSAGTGIIPSSNVSGTPIQ